MAWFGKLFEKKVCAICGGEIGLLGNRKLEDGNMCKHCAAKLSPWFNDRRESTVEQILGQLEYRAANKEKVAAFHITRTIGQYTKVLLDEDAGVFMVTGATDLEEENPDVLSFGDVTGCELDIDEDERELKRTDKEGNQVSYNPPRYEYYYNFYIIIHVHNPYFSEIRFRINSSSVEITPRVAAMPPRPFPGHPGGGMRNKYNPETDVEYRRFREMGEEIRDTLLQARQQARDTAAAAAAPKIAATCPYCGATTTPDANGCCEYCGGSVTV